MEEKRSGVSQHSFVSTHVVSLVMDFSRCHELASSHSLSWIVINARFITIASNSLCIKVMKAFGDKHFDRDKSPPVRGTAVVFKYAIDNQLA